MSAINKKYFELHEFLLSLTKSSTVGNKISNMEERKLYLTKQSLLENKIEKFVCKKNQMNNYMK